MIGDIPINSETFVMTSLIIKIIKYASLSEMLVKTSPTFLSYSSLDVKKNYARSCLNIDFITRLSTYPLLSCHPPRNPLHFI